MNIRSLRGKRVLITGSTGFIGANLAKSALESGAEVHVITRTSSNKWRIEGILPDLVEHLGDLRHQERVESIVRTVRPDIIYHAAAYGGSSAQKDFKEIMGSNFESTVNLVNACKGPGFELFVNAGTSSEYGLKVAPMREEDLLEPINDYGVSKSAATLYCQTLSRREGLPIVTLRLFSPYGNYEGPTRLIPSVILACLREKAPMISSTKFVRDFIYIEDVLSAYAKTGDAKAKDICGGIFNIGSGMQHSVGEVVHQIIDLFGRDVLPISCMPHAWPNEPEMWQADISRARRLLGWEPVYGLKRGLKASVEWFSENLELYQNQDQKRGP